jgi:hypothetical protein
MHKQVGYFKRRKILKNANFLTLTPIRRFDHKTNDQGIVTVLVPRFKDYLGKRLLQPRLKYPYITLELDELGSDTWLLSDGKRDVREICRILKEKYQENIHPAEDRVTRFFSHLYMQKLITFNEILKK